MNKKLPVFNDTKKVCIICEGNEEFFYLEKLNSLKVWNSKYDLSLINAEGNGNIPARYSDSYSNQDGDIILVFCDTEKKPYEQYNDIKKKISKFLDVENGADLVIIYGNPCTMQIILQHWIDVKLTTAAKKINAEYIEKCTGVTDYKGRKKQIELVMEKVTSENYMDMVRRVEDLEINDKIVGSSNFSRLIKYLSSDDVGWIDEINNIINY